MTVSAPQPINSQTLPQTPLLDKSGRLTFPWLKYFQGLQSAQKVVAQSFDNAGSLQAPVGAQTTMAVRGIALDTLLAHITNAGLLDSLTSVAANVDTDHLADGTGSPLAGGKAANTALVTSGPALHQVLEWNGAAWLPASLPANVASLDTITGAITLVAGTGVTISDNTPTAGKITIAAAGGGAGYVKGTVSTGAIAGAGTFTASGTVTGATVGSVVTVGVSNGTEGALLSNLLGWVSALNTVTIQYTSSGASLALVLPVVVFN